MTAERLLLSAEEAADLLNISRRYLYNLLRTGELESVKIGHLRRIPRTALDTYVDSLRSHTSRPGGDPDSSAYLTLEQAAELLSTSTRTLRRCIADGDLPAYKFGTRAVRVKATDLEGVLRRIPTGEDQA